MSKSVGVIGLGNMGYGIAKNIAKGQHDLLVWDAIEEVRSRFTDTARITDPDKMAAEADIIIFGVTIAQRKSEIAWFPRQADIIGRVIPIK